MPSSRLLATTIATSLIASATFVYVHSSRRRARAAIREKLPQDLDTWRIPGRTNEAEEKIWQDLDQVFRDRGYILWPYVGFAYATPSRGIINELDPVGTVRRLARFQYSNPLTRIARTPDGHDVAIRVIVLKSEGHEHLDVLRKIATGPSSLLSNNHALPMFTEFHFDDIVFGIFPMVGGMVEDAYGYWAKNSVGDIVDMLMQALEGLAFIHESKIAHRDAFRDNFLVQWQPESMRTLTIPVSRPRVYLIDFEVAINFPTECPLAECVCTGPPLGGSFSQPEMYSRPLAPEMTTNAPYSPFKTDVWQLGTSFWDFRTTIPDIDQILEEMTHTDPVARLGAQATLEKLGRVVNAVPPASLLIEPKLMRSP